MWQIGVKEGFISRYRFRIIQFLFVTNTCPIDDGVHIPEVRMSLFQFFQTQVLLTSTSRISDGYLLSEKVPPAAKLLAG